MWIEYVAWGIVGLLVFYVLIRVGSAAYFNSKDDYERKINHEPRQPR